MAFKLRSQSPLHQDKNKPTLYDKASDKVYKKVYGIEERVDKALGYPESKAEDIAATYAAKNKGDNMKADKIRHASASMFTRQAISKKLGGGLPGNIVGGIGANVLGLAHEVTSFNSENGILNGVQEMGKDIINNVIGSVSNKKNVISNVEKYGTSGMGTQTAKDMLARKKKSPLLKQKLSPRAAKAKAERDLAFAKTDDRRAKKAHAQRKHRSDPSGNGKDWDHEDQQWETAKRNRGNDGNGTKSESGKKYSTK